MFSNGGNVCYVFCDVMAVSQIFVDLHFYLGRKEKVGFFLFLFSPEYKKETEASRRTEG